MQCRRGAASYIRDTTPTVMHSHKQKQLHTQTTTSPAHTRRVTRGVSRAVSAPRARQNQKEPPDVALHDIRQIERSDQSYPLALTYNGETWFSPKVATHPRRREVEAHEAVHRAQFAAQGRRPAGTLEQLEAEAEKGVAALKRGSALVPLHSASPGLALYFDGLSWLPWSDEDRAEHETDISDEELQQESDLDSVREKLALLWKDMGTRQEAANKGTFTAKRNVTVWTRATDDKTKRGPAKRRLKRGDSVAVADRAAARNGEWLALNVGTDAVPDIGYAKARAFVFRRPTGSESPALTPGRAGGTGIADVLEMIESLPEEERAEHYLKLQSYVPYAGQRDNTGIAWLKKTKAKGVVKGRVYNPDGMCNVTALAMALQANGVKNPVTFNNDPKYTPKTLPPKARKLNITLDTRFEQFEDYIVALIWVKFWGKITVIKSWMPVVEHFDLKFEQPLAGKEILTKDEWKELRTKYLAKGAGIVLGVGGHFVRLQGVDDAKGLIIDDPYGETLFKPLGAAKIKELEEEERGKKQGKFHLFSKGLPEKGQDMTPLGMKVRDLRQDKTIGSKEDRNKAVRKLRETYGVAAAWVKGTTGKEDKYGDNSVVPWDAAEKHPITSINIVYK